MRGQRAITPDIALRLVVFFGTDAQSWVNLQAHYDTEQARVAMEDVLAKIPNTSPWRREESSDTYDCSPTLTVAT